MTEKSLISSFILDNLNSGFTSLTDKAMRQGVRGAEWISDTLSAAFSPFTEFIKNKGGFIAEFEGDAALAVFPGYRPELQREFDQVLATISKGAGKEISFSTTRQRGISVPGFPCRPEEICSSAIVRLPPEAPQKAYFSAHERSVLLRCCLLWWKYHFCELP